MQTHDAIIHPDLLTACSLAYEPNGLSCKNIVHESESKEYAACTFSMNGKNIVFRVANITPTKLGQFVTLWKRSKNGPIRPYDVTDAVDTFIISTRSGNWLGQFIFPKSVLYEKGCVAKDGHGGKRGMRVYPPWDVVTSPQAKKTQAWQCAYFASLQPAVDHVELQKLLR